MAEAIDGPIEESAPDAGGRDPLGPDPVVVLQRWIIEAQAAGLPLPSAMTLATTGPEGPQARTVLITTVVDRTGGLRFHSSTPTGKTRDLAADPRAAGVFHWPALGRQVVLAGRAAELDAGTSAAAFGGRPRALRLLARAYHRLLPGLGRTYAVAPGAVQAAFTEAARTDTGTGPAAEAPDSWTTVELVPDRIDFWQAGDETVPATRTRFRRTDDGWTSFLVLP